MRDGGKISLKCKKRLEILIPIHLASTFGPLGRIKYSRYTFAQSMQNNKVSLTPQKTGALIQFDCMKCQIVTMDDETKTFKQWHKETKIKSARPMKGNIQYYNKGTEQR